MARKKYLVRKWLNSAKHGGNAFIAINAYVHRAGWGADVTIADCTRMVTLDFEATEVANSRAKLDILINELSKLRRVMYGEEQAEDAIHAP